MRLKILTLAIATAAFAAFVVPALAAVEDVELSAKLKGKDEVPGPGDNDGTGVAQLETKIAKSKLCYLVEFENIETATAAHVHKGAKGEAGKGDGGRSSEETPRRDRREAREEAAEPPAVAVRTASNTLDLRGLRVDEAIALTESFLDRLYGSGDKIAYLNHGVGTGALRDAVREYLKGATRYVKRWRTGEPEEGGDRVTVVHLT